MPPERSLLTQAAPHSSHRFPPIWGSPAFITMCLSHNSPSPVTLDHVPEVLRLAAPCLQYGSDVAKSTLPLNHRGGEGGRSDSSCHLSHALPHRCSFRPQASMSITSNGDIQGRPSIDTSPYHPSRRTKMCDSTRTTVAARLKPWSVCLGR